MRHFLFLRHGKIAEEYRKVFYGQLDVPLSEEGIRASQEVVEKLKKYPFKAIYSSPLERALFPARLLSEKTGTPLYIREELKEIHYGEWTGKARHIVMADPLFWARLKDETLSPPGGESIRALKDRAKKFWEQTLINCPEGLYVIFTHGGFLRALISELLHLPSVFFFVFEILHLKGPLISYFDDGNFVIRGFNFDVEILGDLLTESYW